MKIHISFVLCMLSAGMLHSQQGNEGDKFDGTVRVVDIDGNQYPTRMFNGVTWMGQNLKVTRDTASRAVVHYFPGKDPRHRDAYGLLYDFETALKVCPAGWHLPSDEEWQALFSGWGRDTLRMMKDPLFWKEEGQSLTGESGFSARPAGYGNCGEFDDFFGTHAIFWTSTAAEEGEGLAYSYILISGKENYHRAPQHMNYAFSVRCVKDKFH